MSSTPSSTSTTETYNTALSSQESLAAFTNLVDTPPSLMRYDKAIFDISVIVEPVINDNREKEVQHLLYDAIHSHAWTEFEKGRLALPEIGTWFQNKASISPEEFSEKWKSLLFQERNLRKDFTEFVKSLTQDIGIHVLGNLPLPVWSSLKPGLAQCSSLPIHSHISCDVGSRLPYPTIFESAVTSFCDIREDICGTLFVTASVDAHISACAVGLSTLLVDTNKSLLEQIRPFFQNPLPAARLWLQQRAGYLSLRTSIMEEPIRDTYIQLLILELTGEEDLLYPELVDPTAKTLKFSWFVGPRPASIWDFPPDLDCTSLAYLYLPRLVSPSGKVDANKIMDEILQYKVEDTGLLNTYLDHEKVRLDLIALANVLSLFYAYGRGKDITATENFLCSVLRNGAYEKGSHYYTNPNVFLFAISRLLVLQVLPSMSAPSVGDMRQANGSGIHCEAHNHLSSVEQELETVKAKFSLALRQCIFAQMHRETDALGLACRIIAGARCGIQLDSSVNDLLALQGSDGSWPECVIYKFNRRDGVCWHQGLTVALAVKAIEDWDSLRKRITCRVGEKNLFST